MFHLVIPSIVKALSWSLANTVIFLVIRSFASIADLIKSIIACILVLQILLYLLLAFLDAGTLLDNEAESPNEDRIFCVKCSLFRLERSKHCNFCNRCVGRYDHHCGVLKKCIGRRNIHIFTLWVLLLATELPFMVVLCFLELLSS